MEQMIANGIQLIKTNASYVFDSNTVFYRNEIPFANQSNEFDITDCFYAQPIDFTDISVLQFLSLETSLTCVVKNYLGVTLTTINATNVGTYDTQTVFNVEIDWSAITGNLEYCYLEITDGTEYFKSEPLKMINLKQRIKIKYRMLRNHKNIGYFFNPDNEGYQFFHIFYIEAAITEFKREITKSVFEDSNQTLINLFGTFRHSFLVKTFQIAYYMHEKVVTLSLCDEIYLSEIKAGNEYEGRIFLSKDETPEEELISTTNLYVSSTRYVVEDAFRLVGAAQETQIVPIPNLGIIPIHHTSPNGKKVTFQTPYELLATPKTLYTPQGAPTDYLFKIGGTTDNFRNSHDAAWVAIPSKTFAEFSILGVPVNSHVLITYIGSLTQTDIVSTLYAPISDIPVNPSTRSISPNPKIAASDLIIYPKLVTGFDSVGFSSGAANLFSQQRTFAELANSQDLTDYNAGIVNLPITAEEGIGHLFLERTNATPLIANITTNQADPTKEIVAYATPLNNEFYPTTLDGTNPFSIKGDAVNDLLYVPAGATGGDLLYFSNMSVGERRSYTWLGMQNAIGNYQEVGASQSEYMRYLGISNFIEILLGTEQLAYGFEGAEGFSTGNTPVKYITFSIGRNAATGVAGDVYAFELYVNGKRVDQVSATGVATSNTYRFNSVNFNLGMLNGLFFAPDSRRFRNQGLRFFSMHKRLLTVEEIRRIHLGMDIAGFAPNYYYDFTNLVVDGSNRRIPNLGSDSIDDARLENHSNLLTPLFA
jgi:hypothetical protein